MSTTATPGIERLTPEQRSEVLAREVQKMAASGWHVVSQTETQASFEKGKNTSHGLHIFLCIITLGLWIPVWILIVILTGRKTKLITVNEWGGVSRR